VRPKYLWTLRMWTAAIYFSSTTTQARRLVRAQPTRFCAALRLNSFFHFVEENSAWGD